MMGRGVMVLTKFTVAVCLALCVVSFAVGGTAQAAEPIKIGILTCLTGPVGFIGQPVKEAFVAVFDDINAKGGVLGRKLEVYIEDDQSNPSNAVIAATKLIKDQKVSLVIGASLADSDAAIIPTVEQEHIPMLVAGPLVSAFKKDVFLMGPGDARGAAHIMEFVCTKLGAKKIALLRDTATYGSEGSKYYHQEVKKYPGASIIIEEKMEMVDTNVVPQLTKIKAAKPDVLIIHSTSVGPVAKNFKQLGMTVQVYGSHAMPSVEFLKLSGAIAEESHWIMTASKMMIAEKLPASDPYRKNLYDPFIKILRDKYGPTKNINVFHSVSYDAAMVTVEALKIAGTDNRAALRDAIEKVRFDGLNGQFACTPTDHQGSPKDTMPEIMVKGGEYVPYTK
jgi:branched-chain amino acid transport system substrate-binding protein